MVGVTVAVDDDMKELESNNDMELESKLVNVFCDSIMEDLTVVELAVMCVAMLDDNDGDDDVVVTSFGKPLLPMLLLV